jgi:hypothetical protein
MKAACFFTTLLVMASLGLAANSSGWSDIFSLTNLTGPIALEQSVLSSGDPAGFSVFPNPFGSGRALNFTVAGIPENRMRTGVLQIYNITGVLVKSLSLSQFHGSSLVWDARSGQGRNLSSGMYVARLSVGNLVVEKSFLLLK